MPTLVNKNQTVAYLKQNQHLPQSQILAALRAHGALKKEKFPHSLETLKGKHLKRLATPGRIKKALQDVDIAIPDFLKKEGKVQKVLDKTVWELRDRYVHRKVSRSGIRERVVGSVFLRETLERDFTEEEREEIFTDILPIQYQTCENFSILGAEVFISIPKEPSLSGCEILARDLRRQGIFQCAQFMPLQEREIYDGWIQSDRDRENIAEKLLGLKNFYRHADLRRLFEWLKNGPDLYRQFSGDDRFYKATREFGLSLFMLQTYYDNQEPRLWKLVIASAVTSLYMTFMFFFRMGNLYNSLPWEGLENMNFALILLWGELYAYYDTAVHRAITAYGVKKLKGTHGQNFVPVQIWRMKDILKKIKYDEAILIHVANAYNEPVGVVLDQLEYAAKSIDEATNVVLWDASLLTYYLFGARGAVLLTKAQLGLRGLFEDAIARMFPDAKRGKNIAQVLTDASSELHDIEMSYFFYYHIIQDIGRDELALADRKVELLSQFLSSALLKIYNSIPLTCEDFTKAWENQLSGFYIYELALQLKASEEKARMFARRVYETTLSRSRQERITHLSQELIRAGNANLEILSRLVADESGLTPPEALQFLKQFLEERDSAVSLAYKEAIPIEPLLRTGKGRELFGKIYNFMIDSKRRDEISTSIAVDLEEILRLITGKILFFEPRNSAWLRTINPLRKDRLPMRLAVEMADGIRAHVDLYALYSKVNERLRGQSNVSFCQFMDAERAVFSEVSGQIAFVVEKAALNHKVPKRETERLKDAIVEEWFYLNYWKEGRTAAFGLAHDLMIHDKSAGLKFFLRDILLAPNPYFINAATEFFDEKEKALGKK